MDLSFRADGGVLRLETATFHPDGLHAGDEVFAWDGVGGVTETMRAERWSGLPRHGWCVAWRPVPPYGLGLVVQVEVTGPGGAQRTVPVGGSFAPQGANDAIVALALAAFLRDEPAARDGLRGASRLLALTKALRAMPRPGKGLPREPLMGDKHDLHHAVVRGYRATLKRRHDDRPPDTDPPPVLADVVAATRAALPGRLAGRFTDDDIAERAVRYVEQPPWPFARLLDAA